MYNIDVRCAYNISDVVQKKQKIHSAILLHASTNHFLVDRL